MTSQTRPAGSRPAPQLRGLRRNLVRGAALFALVVTLAPLHSCAFFNTYYLARKSYLLGTAGQPYPVEKPDPAQGANFQKAVDLSKKVITDYPGSKFVDDAYLLWAKALLGRDDPLQTITMLTDFGTRFPNSPLKNEALFFLGVAQRQARRYADADQTFGQFLHDAPKSPLVPYALLERARVLSALEKYDDAAAAAGGVLEHYGHSKLASPARLARAEALYLARRYDAAAQDFRWIGHHARTDEDRLTYLFREADALEAAHAYDQEMSLLRSAIGHEHEPQAPGTTPNEANPQYIAQPSAGGDPWSRLMLRIGTVHLLAGRVKDALDAYQRVLQDVPHTPLAAEAQYRIGYAYEIGNENFDQARSEYQRVREQSQGSPFTDQAQQRLATLERVSRLRSSGADSLARRAEAGLLLAEIYLFQHEKPERALEQYRALADTFRSTPAGARAELAAGWVLARKLKRQAEADSLWWDVVRNHAGTEAQLAARDYLEAEGRQVPDTLIKAPLAPETSPDTTTQLTAPPKGTIPLGASPSHGPALLHTPGPPAGLPNFGDTPGLSRGGPDEPALFGPGENPPRVPAPTDTLRFRGASGDTLRRPAVRDTTRTPFKP